MVVESLPQICKNAKNAGGKIILADIKKPKNNKFTFYHCDVSNQNNVTDFTSKLIKKEKKLMF